MSADIFIYESGQYFRDPSGLMVPALTNPGILVIGSMIPRQAACEVAEMMEGRVGRDEAMVWLPLSVFRAAAADLLRTAETPLNVIVDPQAQ